VVSELIELSFVIGDIYDAAIDPTLWQKALASICNYVGGYAGVLFWHDTARQSAQALHLFNDDPNYTRLYFEKYLPMDPFFPASSFVEAGTVFLSSEIVPQAELEATRFYKEWIKPQGIVDAMAVNLEKGVTRSSFLVIRTNESLGVIDDGMRERAAALVPHLLRAITIGRLFDQKKAADGALTETLDHIEAAVFLVSSDGMISFANDPAKKMLDDAKLMRESGGVLHAVSPKTDRILYDIFAAAERGDASVGARGVAVPLAGSSPDPWFAHVLPLTSGRRQEAGQSNHAVAAVFVRKAGPNAPQPMEVIGDRYGLLPSEVRVLNAVAKVQGVRELADFLGISQATVKTHLHNLFRKTGTKRQSELVKLVAGI
jgi:DNA-binding CsgD family transcriptional regulator